MVLRYSVVLLALFAPCSAVAARGHSAGFTPSTDLEAALVASLDKTPVPATALQEQIFVQIFQTVTKATSKGAKAVGKAVATTVSAGGAVAGQHIAAAANDLGNAVATVHPGTGEIIKGSGQAVAGHVVDYSNHAAVAVTATADVVAQAIEDPVGTVMEAVEAASNLGRDFVMCMFDKAREAADERVEQCVRDAAAGAAKCVSGQGCILKVVGCIRKDLAVEKTHRREYANGAAALSTTASATVETGADMILNMDSGVYKITVPFALTLAAEVRAMASAAFEAEDTKTIPLGPGGRPIKVVPRRVIFVGYVPVEITVYAEPTLEISRHASAEGALTAVALAEKSVSLSPTITLDMANGEVTVGGVAAAQEEVSFDVAKIVSGEISASASATLQASAHIGVKITVEVNKIETSAAVRMGVTGTSTVSGSASATAQAQGTAEAVCHFSVGDGVGGYEVFVGYASSEAHCFEMVKAQKPGANGATVQPGGGSCYAEFGMTSQNGNGGWRTCLFQHVQVQAGAACEGSLTAGAKVETQLNLPTLDVKTPGELAHEACEIGADAVCEKVNQEGAAGAAAGCVGFPGGALCDMMHAYCQAVKTALDEATPPEVHGAIEAANAAMSTNHEWRVLQVPAGGGQFRALEVSRELVSASCPAPGAIFEAPIGSGGALTAPDTSAAATTATADATLVLEGAVFKPSRACTGSTIGDYVAETTAQCMELCATTNGCRCATWMHESSKKCRLETGTEATPRGGQYSAMLLKDFGRVNMFRDGSTCSGSTIGTYLLNSQKACMEKCRATGGCKCVTWMKDLATKCRLETGTHLTTGRSTSSYSGLLLTHYGGPAGMMPEYACTGSTIGRHAINDKFGCAKKCLQTAGCNCITFAHFQSKKCILETGHDATFRNTDEYSALMMYHFGQMPGMSLGYACGGSAIKDLAVAGQERCLEECEKQSGCNCMTWRHWEAAKCRLETGPTATARNTKAYSSKVVARRRRAPGWHSGYACTGSTIEDRAVLTEASCIAACNGVAGCNCVTWMHDQYKQCRLETGGASHRGDGNMAYSAVNVARRRRATPSPTPAYVRRRRRRRRTYARRRRTYARRRRRRAYVSQHACGGSTLYDTYSSSQAQCVDQCLGDGRCRCVTWMFHNSKKCRLETGTSHTYRGNSAYAATMVRLNEERQLLRSGVYTGTPQDAAQGPDVSGATSARTVAILGSALVGSAAIALTAMRHARRQLYQQL